MANKFFPRMPNLVEVLNQMWAAFTAGPYNAVPLTGGTMSGKLVLPSIRVGPLDFGQLNAIGSTDQAEGAIALVVSNSVEFNVCAGPIANSARSGIRASSNAVTGRGVSTGGTFNANGADYAEYMIKRGACGTIRPGQIIGIDTDGRLTDKWDLSISFAVKSTNPCMVGGDSWGAHLGERPADPVRPLAPVRQEGDTDDQWARALAADDEAQQAFETALAAALVAQQAFDVALEAARQTVDRIAFAGQVPVNQQGTTPGQFIVPVQDGEGIGSLAVNDADITFQQYKRAVGRVIAIEEDGRARIIVKVA